MICAHCPIGPGCLAETSGNRSYCDYADPTHPAFMPDIEMVLRGEVGFFDAPSRKGMWRPGGGYVPGREASASVVVEIDPAFARIEACDFRRSDCNCISKPARCYQATFPVVVDLATCRACVTAGPSAP